MSTCRICVVGAGVIGLSVAVRLLEDWPPGTCHVTVMADAFYEDTTSDGAFGYWEPHMLSETPITDIRRWASATFDHMLSLASSPEAGPSGTFTFPVYTLFRGQAKQDPIMKEITPNFRLMTKKELERYPDYQSGVTFTSATSEGRNYLPWLTNRIKSRGGVLLKRHLKSLTELYAEYDVIVNCCGLGARELCGDQEMMPIKGQTIRVEAPWIKHAVIVPEDLTCILPGAYNVLLGLSHGFNEWDKTLSQTEKETILAKTCRLEPSLKKSRFLRDWVGLRPGRRTIRLERECERFGNRTVKIVHNYGHGGAGVTLHWGCAEEAARLALLDLSPPDMTVSKL